MIVRRFADKDDELARHLVRRLNAPLDWPEGAGLNTGQVAEIASAAACDVSYNQAANGHLANLFAALPLPGTPEGRDFWHALGQAGGDAALYIDPANAGGPFFDRLIEGNEAGITDRVLSFLGELSDQQREAVADVIGSALARGTFTQASPRYIGRLWLRDAETTAWHVLLASRLTYETDDDRQQFLEAWGNA
ncbi:hypothetical protein [Streptomyces ortus]|uniref:Uncharacterized protein n=1 Tax=Streptomyces ortus TaxID=2867268 RepID=A0ABT3UYQ4_9ACTN|nr:hypothetical protein [Streptomyces ortus]MCX4231814.1 hypothetical protein [Streptomyces ortus]